MTPRDSASYIKRVTAKSGVTYFYFHPPACMADHPQAGRSLGRDEDAAHARVALLLAQGAATVQPESPDPEAMAKYLMVAFREARGRAQRKNLSLSIDSQFVAELMAAQRGCCAVSGIRFSLQKHEGAYHRPFVPSIDRIDSSKGYDPENVRLVCMAVNIGLGAWGNDVFSAVMRGARRRAHIGNIPTG